jgi:hypothetical protein
VDADPEALADAAGVEGLWLACDAVALGGAELDGVPGSDDGGSEVGSLVGGSDVGSGSR